MEKNLVLGRYNIPVIWVGSDSGSIPSYQDGPGSGKMIWILADPEHSLLGQILFLIFETKHYFTDHTMESQ